MGGTLAALISCSRSEEPRIIAAADLSPEGKDQARRAIEARDLLFRSLLGELSEALQEGGPASAIPVCRERAPAIAREVAAKTGIAIGRTAFRLRNPENACPAWARKLVDARVREPTHVVLPRGGLGVLLPIITSAPCLQCHGEDARIPSEVKGALATSYPSDAATGFREGDLRGWFWIEVPVERGR